MMNKFYSDSRVMAKESVKKFQQTNLQTWGFISFYAIIMCVCVCVWDIKHNNTFWMPSILDYIP